MAQAGTLAAEALCVPAVAAPPPTRPLQESWRVSDGLCLASPGGECSAPIKLESEKQVCEVSAALAVGVGEGGRSCPLRTRPPTLRRPLCARSWRCADGPSPTLSFTPSGGAWFSCLPPRTLGLSPPSKSHSWGGWTQTLRPPQTAWVRPQGQGFMAWCQGAALGSSGAEGGRPWPHLSPSVSPSPSDPVGSVLRVPVGLSSCIWGVLTP